MAETIRVDVQGVKAALRTLRRLDPDMRKQFDKNAREVVKPLMDDAKQRYTRVPLSGFNRRWVARGTEITPRTIGRYRSGVTFKVNTSDKRGTVFTVLQRNAAASVFDMAGRRSSNNLSRSLEAAGWGTASRVMWPAAETKGDAAVHELMRLVDEVAATINRDFN